MRGAAILGSAQLIKLLLTVLSTVVLSRLLTPDDYGVMAMLTPIVALLFLLQDLGLNVAAVQRPNLNYQESSALFWVNVLTSAALALILLAVAPLVAWFYKDVRTGYATAASAASMLVSGLSLQHSALLNREMRFGSLSVIEISTAVLTTAMTAALALWLRSYWALMLGSLVGVVWQSALLWRVCSFRPSWPPAIGAARSMLSTGGYLSGANILNFLIRNVDTVLIARFTGSAAAGLYDRCYRLMMLPIQNINVPISRLLLPLLSRNLTTPVTYRRQFLLAARGVTLISAPGVAVATGTSSALMPFLLGAEWSAAGPIFFWLGLTGLVQPVSNLTGVLLMSSGNTRRLMQIGVPASLLTLAAFATGIFWGPEGIAAAFFVSVVVRLPIQFWWITRGSAVSATDLWRAQIEPLVGAAIAGFAAHRLLATWSLIETLVFMTPISYLLSLSTSLVMSNDGKTQSYELLFIAKRFLAGNRTLKFLRLGQ